MSGRSWGTGSARTRERRSGSSACSRPIKIAGADTGGQYGLLEIEVRPGEGSPWHVHPEEDEWFYVLEGQFTFHVGDAAVVQKELIAESRVLVRDCASFGLPGWIRLAARPRPDRDRLEAALAEELCRC